MHPTQSTPGGYDWAADPLVFLFLLLLTPMSTLVGVVAAQPVILAAFNTFALLPYFLFAVRKGRLGRAWLFVAVWAAVLYATSLIIGIRWPQRAEEMLPQTIEIRAELLSWIATGNRNPSDRAAPLRDGAMVALTSLPTAGLAGLYLEATSLNRTAIAISRLAQRSKWPIPAAMMLWPWWDVARHVAQWLLIALFAEPLLRLSLSSLVQRWRTLVAAIAFWLFSLAIEEVASPLWLTWTRSMTGLG